MEVNCIHPVRLALIAGKVRNVVRVLFFSFISLQARMNVVNKARDYDYELINLQRENEQHTNEGERNKRPKFDSVQKQKASTMH